MVEEDIRDQEKRLEARSLFKDIEGFVEVMSRVIEGRQKEEEEQGPTEIEGLFRAQLRGNPRRDRQIQGLGAIDLDGAEKRRQVVEERMLVVDVFDEGDFILAVVELPGVSQENIRLELRGDIMALSTTGSWDRGTETLLPCMVAAESLATTYKNGVLEIRVRKCTS